MSRELLMALSDVATVDADVPAHRVLGFRL